jgi:anthranilate synthase component II
LRVFLIDNNDSFTYNLKHYIEQFASEVVVSRGAEIELDDIEPFDKIILSPGPGLPNEHPILRKVLSRYYNQKPILGICLGQQAIAEFFNANLENLTTVKHGVTSMVKHFNNCKLFSDIPENFKIGHYHSWVVSKINLPDELTITSENEEGIITSLNHKKHDISAVQFHPESILTEYGLLLIKNWVLT